MLNDKERQYRLRELELGIFVALTRGHPWGMLGSSEVHEVAMHQVSVTEVLSGNTIAVWPPWTLNGAKGTLVRIHRLSTPREDSPRSVEARCRLMFLISGCVVVIKQVYGVENGVLVCDVHYLGRHVADHLPQLAEKNAIDLGRVDTARPTNAEALASVEAVG